MLFSEKIKIINNKIIFKKLKSESNIPSEIAISISQSTRIPENIPQRACELKKKIKD